MVLGPPCLLSVVRTEDRFLLPLDKEEPGRRTQLSQRLHQQRLCFSQGALPVVVVELGYADCQDLPVVHASKSLHHVYGSFSTWDCGVPKCVSRLYVTQYLNLKEEVILAPNS